MLIEEHQRLDDEADELSSRRYLLPFEQVHLKELKVERLHVRTAIEKYKTSRLPEQKKEGIKRSI